jgi:hypothetical protein
MVVEQPPSAEELARRVVLRCNEIIMRIEERHEQEIKNILKRINDDPTLQYRN